MEIKKECVCTLCGLVCCIKLTTNLNTGEKSSYRERVVVNKTGCVETIPTVGVAECMKRKYREVKYECGEFLDVEFFPVYKKSKRRGAKCNPTSEGQKLLNQKRSKRRLTRLIHANFCERDYALHLTYDENNMPEDETVAKKNVSNFLRRLKRLCQKLGIELKYICVTEKGKKSARLHHHLIISGGVSRDDVERLWKMGRANTKRLQFDDNGVAGLSHYISKQALFYRRWNGSKNLIYPDVKVNDYRFSRSKAHNVCRYEDKELLAVLYPGYTLSGIEFTESDISGEFYGFLRLRKRI